MKNTIHFLLIIFTIALVSSCSDDKGTNITLEDPTVSFDINEGNIWYYNWVTVNGQDTIIGKGNNTIFVKDTATIDGYKCFIEDDNSDRFPTLYAIRTDENGYYMYNMNFHNHLKENYPDVKSGWVKQISFTEEEWTDFVLRNEYTEDGITYIKEIAAKGKLIKHLDIEYKGEMSKAMITTFHLERIETKIDNGIIQTDTTGAGYEYTVIKDVGIYKCQSINYDETYNFYRELYDHK